MKPTPPPNSPAFFDKDRPLSKPVRQHAYADLSVALKEIGDKANAVAPEYTKAPIPKKP